MGWFKRKDHHLDAEQSNWVVRRCSDFRDRFKKSNRAIDYEAAMVAGKMCDPDATVGEIRFAVVRMLDVYERLSDETGGERR